MRKKVILALLALFMFFLIGAAITVFYISNTTSELNRIIKLHEVEGLRRSLVIDLQTVQTDLYTVHTPLGRKLDSIIKNVQGLDKAAKQCTTCHHSPKLTKGLKKVQSLINEYKTALSFTITASANEDRVNKLKMDTAKIGEEIFDLTDYMSFKASANLDRITKKTMSKINHVKTILLITVIMTFFLALMVAVKLTDAITKPIKKIVNATRMIAKGNLGYCISYKDKTEFSELADHFNVMSNAVYDGYEKIQKEINERMQTEKALAKSEKFLGTIFDSIRDPFCIIDRDYRIIKSNSAYADMKNRHVEDIIGKTCFKTLLKRDRICEDCIVAKTFLSSEHFTKEKPVTLKDGSKAWVEIYTYPIFDENGIVSHVIEYTRDITERKNALEALRESEERYALAARGANDGLWDWDLKSNVIYFSPRWKSLFGHEEDEIEGRPQEWFNMVHPIDRAQLETDLSNHINGLTSQFESEHRMLHKDGTYRWMYCKGVAVRDKKGEIYRIAGSLTDITERKVAEEQLLYDAFHDVLTALPNRALFMDRLNHAIKRSKRGNDYRFAILFIDMDRFKVLNDSLGHTVGDELLVAIAQRLKTCIRPGDTVARLGGDEFAILLDNTEDVYDAENIAERIHNEMKFPFNLKGQEVFISASIGITLSDEDYFEPEQLLRDADIAMYNAKAIGRACHIVFDKSMRAHATTLMQLETDLRQAVERNEFLIYYQPIIEIKTGTIVGFEALLRWKIPRRDLILPGEFISVAEETGMIIPIGEWVLRNACHQACLWQKEFPSRRPLKIGVNISSKQFSPQLVGQLEKILNETGLPPDSLILEITESMIMENAESAAVLLAKLKKMDIQLHIDDFGTGYSSLSYLHRFPIDALKIDRSFIRMMSIDKDNFEIVKAIATLAHNLKMEVIAEGVETKDQMEKLKTLDCEYMQGFLFSEPLDNRASGNLISKKKISV